MTHSVLIAVSDLPLKIKIMMTTMEKTAPGHIKEPGGTTGVTAPT